MRRKEQMLQMNKYVKIRRVILALRCAINHSSRFLDKGWIYDYEEDAKKYDEEIITEDGNTFYPNLCNGVIISFYDKHHNLITENSLYDSKPGSMPIIDEQEHSKKKSMGDKWLSKRTHHYVTSDLEQYIQYKSTRLNLDLDHFTSGMNILDGKEYLLKNTRYIRIHKVLQKEDNSFKEIGYEYNALNWDRWKTKI